MSTKKLRSQAPWWLSLALAALGILGQWSQRETETNASTNREAIEVLLEALSECQAAK